MQNKSHFSGEANAENWGTQCATFSKRRSSCFEFSDEDMDLYLSQVYLRINECNELEWNWNGAHRFLIPIHHTLQNTHAARGHTHTHT